jgi:hypothetical protein
MKRLFLFIILTIALVAGSGALTNGIVNAQDPGGSIVTITGTLTGTTADGGIIVDGTTYHLASSVSLPPGTIVGTKITISGTVSNSTSVIIITVIRVAEPTPTPAVTAAATSPATPPATAAPIAAATEPAGINIPGVIIVVEGPVRARQANFITIYDFNIQMVPDDPMLTIIKIGDKLHVKGSLDKAGVLVAIEVGNVIARRSGGNALVEGRVQAVNGNVLTINGINVQLAPTDPRLKTLRAGTFLSVSGNFERHGTIIVLIVVNIVVVNDADINLFIYCREHPGMGMGMAEPPGMGMGDDGMGMGKPAMGMSDYDCRWP